ncbi:DUF1501 domain-containing protein [Oceanihabitans sp. 2_MG-2023]|uniref:DUF1501 domain-containing protein n=1 Tax=Oceanihabitans sp. 2_MG-2023 TaxID=3062661 RepID=UPI0026E247B0|nr:DUF1501 domain-containing protein [Oceanihabitans sp. 2_MG-2023]MDO6595739.1 DUF1501 domain-containing protein [Oceanihabitans sp. 2_MG-2023]
MKRRQFIKNSSLASTLFFVPSFVKAFEKIAIEGLGYKKLVIIQLSGGNDGLNTVIPYKNDLYYKLRPTISIKENKVIKLNDTIGLHPSLTPLKKLYDQGLLAIVNNVGYPNPNRSHFRSTDIWQTASDSSEYIQSGWVGRYLDAFGKNYYNAIEIDDSLSLMMKGENISGIATKSASRLYSASQDPFFKKILSYQNDEHLSEHNLGYLYKTMIAAESSAKHIFFNAKKVVKSNDYPNNGFANQLKTMAQFINSGMDTKVFYSSLGGFDTHSNQNNKQKVLLEMYAESMEAFVRDLKQQNTFKDTLILTFTEFGRRVQQNSSNGTDHGAANNVFIIGDNLKKQGLYNDLASLSDLDANGDIKYEIDFRTIYATILKKWLQVDDKIILNKSFEQLDFI